MNERSKARRLIQDSDEFMKSIQKFNTPTPKEPETPKPPPVGLKRIELLFNQNKLHFWPSKKEELRPEIITFVETFYYTHKTLPNKADFENRFDKAVLPTSLSDWQELLLSLEEPLTNRGIRPYDTPLEYLEPNFVLAVSLIVNCYDKRAISAKLKEAGLTTKQWTGLLRDQAHKDYYNKRLGEIFDEDTTNDAKVALRQLIAEGDLGAIRHYHELQNIYRPQQNANAHILLALQAIMEILALHVSPEILGRVANDIKSSPTIVASLSEGGESKAS